uniref:Uncharacterized protein n=1 Tax=Octopus bimaculoides TaxID=37653 RepID=A0A0L8GSG0_OCTBM
MGHRRSKERRRRKGYMSDVNVRRKGVSKDTKSTENREERREVITDELRREETKTMKEKREITEVRKENREEEKQKRHRGCGIE